MSTLYIPIAPPGAGKSTLAALMVEAGMLDEDAVICPDDYRRLLTGDATDQTVNGPVFKMVEMIVEHRLSCGLDVYVDATNLRGSLANWCKIAQFVREVDGAPEVQVIAIEFDTPPDVIRAQNAGRERQVPDDVMDRMIGYWLEPNMDQIRCDRWVLASDLRMEAESRLLPTEPFGGAFVLAPGGLADAHWEEYVRSIHHHDSVEADPGVQ